MTLRLGDTLIAGSGANQDLSNLTSQGKNIANWSSNVTNCITEIPQDIKVGLNNGGLYLKAGCKYCVPNGFEQDGVTPHFDFVTVNADTSSTAYGAGRTECMVVWSTDHFEWSRLSSFHSGSTQPTDTWWIWYDTTTNKIKHYNGSTIVDGVSFPICMITENAGTGYDSTVKSIDHVFNGFGYIGSTWFLLPNVKFSATYGKNDDGSYKTYIINNPSVKTLTRTSGALSNWVICTSIVNYEVYDIHYELDCYIVNGLPSSGTSYTSYFNMQDGLPYYTASGTTPNVTIAPRIKLVENCSCDSNGKVTNYGKFLLPFANALSINDSSTISGWSMPSSRYMDLTLLASGSQYTAPANGWLFFSKGATAANQEVYIADVNELFAWEDICPVSGQYCQITVPWEKGHIYKVAYGLAGTTIAFRFFYAEGEN